MAVRVIGMSCNQLDDKHAWSPLDCVEDFASSPNLIAVSIHTLIHCVELPHAGSLVGVGVVAAGAVVAGK